MTWLLRAIITALALISFTTVAVSGEANTDTDVAGHLRPCYKDPVLNVRDNRLPMTMNALIDIVRRAENSTLSPRSLPEMVTSLLASYRQDGIYQTGQDGPILPYAAQGFQFAKHKIIMTYLLAGDSKVFPNESLSSLEQCTLHYMVSSSFELGKRDDGDRICSSLAHYKSRGPRSINDDTELVEGFNANDMSSCPVESGAVYTQWGAVNVGNLLSGIAAGLKRENFDVRRVDRKLNSSQIIDNLYGVTITADLAEAALRQKNVDKKIGVGGGWNDTLVPKWYMAERNTDLEMTDPEIRGGIDGFLIGSEIKTWYSRNSNLKLSQILDLYYSDQGLFKKDLRACNRMKQFDATSKEELVKQTLAMLYLYKKEGKPSFSPDAAQLISLSETVVSNFYNHLPSIEDVKCSIQDEVPSTISTELIVVADMGWQYKTLSAALSYILSHSNVSPYGSRYTVMNAQDGSLITVLSHLTNEFQSNFSEEAYIRMPKGFDVTTSFTNVEHIVSEIVNAEQKEQTSSGRSLIVLFIPSETSLPADEKKRAILKAKYLTKNIPDVKILFLAKNKEAFANIVTDEQNDIFILNDVWQGSNSDQALSALIHRITEHPMRVNNPNCGSKMSSSRSGATKLKQQIQPNTINYYRVMPNYFYYDGKHGINIKKQTNCALTVCHSRSIALPRGNQTTGVTCKEATQSDLKISLNDACEDKDTIKECPPLYFSVEASNCTESTCTDQSCRSPAAILFTIETQNFVCASCSFRVISSACLIAFFSTILTFLLKTF